MNDLLTKVAAPVLAGLVLLSACERKTPTAGDTAGSGPSQSSPAPGSSTAPPTESGSATPTTPGGTTGMAPGGTSGSTTGSTAGSATGGSGSGEPATTGSTPAATITASDRTFLENAARTNLAEIEASRAAAERATTAALRAFAETMLRDHTKMDQELRELAQRKGVTLPTQTGTAEAAELQQLLGARAAQFDRIYIERIGRQAHHDALNLFQQAARDAHDADVKAFASRGVPALRSHLAQAERLPRSGAAGSTESGKSRS